jgi:hypothetical protein
MYIWKYYSRRNEVVSRGEDSAAILGGNTKTFFKRSTG